jgi:hypothetical protein
MIEFIKEDSAFSYSWRTENVKRATIQLHAVQFNKLYLDQTSQAVHINTIWHNAPVELISHKFLLTILSIYSEYSFCLILLNKLMSQNYQYPFLFSKIRRNSSSKLLFNDCCIISIVTSSSVMTRCNLFI